MLKNQRQREILNILNQKNGFVSVKELCTELFASESSIRRDLTQLENKGIIKRIYGGAELIRSLSNVVTFSQRTQLNINAKKIIAQKAASLIHDGDIVFLDQSSSTFYLADEIKDNHSLTVVTNSIEIMRLLSNTGIKVIASGGLLSTENRTCLVGADAQKVFENMFADIFFFSAKSLAEDGTISDCTREEVLVRKPMLKNAAKKVFLCNSEKFGTRSAYIQCNLSDVDFLVCESEKAKDFQKCSESLQIL